MKRAIVVLLLLIANAIFGAQQTTAPDTAPGKLLQEWLRALNAADADALRTFAETRSAMMELVTTGNPGAEPGGGLCALHRKPIVMRGG